MWRPIDSSGLLEEALLSDRFTPAARASAAEEARGALVDATVDAEPAAAARALLVRDRAAPPP
jgi:hypothetical protein